MRLGGTVGDSTKLALIIDAIRGGSEAFDDEVEIAEKIRVSVPGVKRMIGWADKFTAGAAELGAAGGIGSVVIGGTGFPVNGDPPHRAAAAASPAARFAYTTASEIVLAMRRRSLESDPRAIAFLASVLAPARLVGRARSAGLDGPLQVQWGFGSWLLSEQGGAELAKAYAEVLPRGSQVVMLSAEHAAGIGDLAGERMYGHAPEMLAGWAAAAGLGVAWGRDDWPEGDLRRDWAAGLVSGLVAVKPLARQGADEAQRRVLLVFGLVDGAEVGAAHALGDARGVAAVPCPPQVGHDLVAEAEAAGGLEGGQVEFELGEDAADLVARAGGVDHLGGRALGECHGEREVQAARVRDERDQLLHLLCDVVHPVPPRQAEKGLRKVSGNHATSQHASRSHKQR